MPEQEINLNLKQTSKNKAKINFKLLLSSLFILSLLGLAAFLVGYNIPRKEEPKFIETRTPSTNRQGWFVYKTDNYSVEYPADWRVEKSSPKEPNKATIVGKQAKIHIWTNDEKGFKYKSEKLSQLKSQTLAAITIDGIESSLTENLFANGEVFLSISIPESGKNPKTTIWIISLTDADKKTALEILKTLKFSKEK